jgi:DNA-directed RNA polymerase sigma subunit (sigma70/sigma32)
MKRSEVIDIIDGILIDHELPVLQGISKQILSKLESLGFARVETYGDDEKYTEVVPYEPEEGWDVHFEEQDRKDQARDFQVVASLSEYTGRYALTRGMEIAQQFLEGKSFEELSQQHNVTRERIRQIVAKERRRYQRWLERGEELKDG